jgi:hypothetical protein
VYTRFSQATDQGLPQAKQNARPDQISLAKKSIPRISSAFDRKKRYAKPGRNRDSPFSVKLAWAAACYAYVMAQ